MAQQGQGNGGGNAPNGGPGAPDGRPTYGVLQAEKMMLEMDLEDARFLIGELVDIADATTAGYVIGQKTALFNWLRRNLTPGGDITERRVRSLGRTLGVPSHTVRVWIQEFITATPSYGIAGRRKLPKQRVTKTLIARMEEDTVGVPPKLSKSIQKMVNASHDVVRDSLQSGNARRTFNNQVTPGDAKRYLAGNTIRTLSGSNKGTAFRGKK